MQRIRRIVLLALSVCICISLPGCNKVKSKFGTDSFVAGQIVTLGTYEQDDNTENGPEPIEWIVAYVDDVNERALLVSKYIIDYMPFNMEDKNILWRNSDMRIWLNETFYEENFSEDDKKFILESVIGNKETTDSAKLKREEADPTIDNIFLLSEDEIKNEEFVFRDDASNDNRLECTMTASAYSMREYYLITEEGQNIKRFFRFNGIDTGVPTSWWLRTDGVNDNTTALVAYMNDKSELFWIGLHVNSWEGIRPAMYIKIK